MSNEVRLPVSIRSIRAQSTWSRLAEGTMRVYTAPMAADADTAIGAQVLLAVHTFPLEAGSVEDGVFSAANLPVAPVLASGTVAWVRLCDAEGDTVADVTAGPVGSGEGAEFDTLTVIEGGTLACTSLAITEY